MRSLPISTELSEQQRSIYEDDLDKILFITGPPGTGKTVIAILRAERMAKNEEKVSLYMFNRVLKQYTKKQVSHILKKQDAIRTLQKDMFNTFKNMGNRLPYGLNGAQLWNSIYREIDREDDIDRLKRVFRRQIIIDEGQDFPNETYRALSLYWGKLRQKKINFVPTVLADENQKITEDGSTIEEIRKELTSLTIANYAEKILDQNYRNTKEIAKFAAKFYAGAPTERPKDKNCGDGQKPIIFWHDENSIIKRIIQFKINNPEKNIGIIVCDKYSTKIVARIYKQLEEEIKKRKESNIHLQQYYSDNENKDKTSEMLENLNFVIKNSITVVGKGSAKGLEFDCVFIPRANHVIDDNDLTQGARDLYTMLHRAREYLFIGCEVDDIHANKNLVLPKLFSENLKVDDYKFDEIEVGFKNEDELKIYCDIEKPSNKNNESLVDVISQLRKLKVENNSNIKIKTDKRIDTKKAKKLAEKKIKKEKDELEFRRLQKKTFREFISEAQDNDKDKKSFKEKIRELHPDDQRELTKEFKQRMQFHIDLRQRVAEKTKGIKRNASNFNDKPLQEAILEISKITGHGALNDFIYEKIKMHLFDQDSQILQIWSIKKAAKRLLMRLNSDLEKKWDITTEIQSENNTILLKKINGRNMLKIKKIIIHSVESYQQIKSGLLIVTGIDDINEHDNMDFFKAKILNIIKANRAGGSIYFHVRDYENQPQGVKMVHDIIKEEDKSLATEEKLIKSYDL